MQHATCGPKHTDCATFCENTNKENMLKPVFCTAGISTWYHIQHVWCPFVCNGQCKAFKGLYPGNLKPKWNPKTQVTGITLFPPTQYVILHFDPYALILCVSNANRLRATDVSAASIKLQHTCFVCCLCQVATYMLCLLPLEVLQHMCLVWCLYHFITYMLCLLSL